MKSTNARALTGSCSQSSLDPKAIKYTGLLCHFNICFMDCKARALVGFCCEQSLDPKAILQMGVPHHRNHFFLICLTNSICSELQGDDVKSCQIPHCLQHNVNSLDLYYPSLCMQTFLLLTHLILKANLGREHVRLYLWQSFDRPTPSQQHHQLRRFDYLGLLPRETKGACLPYWTCLPN